MRRRSSKPVTCCERAVAIDPGLAQAYAFLAIVGGAEYANGWNGRMARS